MVCLEKVVIRLKRKQSRNREVARGLFADLLVPTVPDERQKFRLEVGQQSVDACRRMPIGMERDGEGQLAAHDQAHHIPVMLALQTRADELAWGLVRKDQQSLIAPLIELSQIVEADPGMRDGILVNGERSPLNGQLLQNAKANALPRNLSQGLLHASDMMADVIPRGLQQKGIHAGEPADGSADIKRILQGFASVALHGDQRGLLAMPSSQRPAQGSEQDVVHLGLIRVMGLCQQCPGLRLGQGDGERLAVPIPVFMILRVWGRWGFGTLQHALPIGAFSK